MDQEEAGTVLDKYLKENQLVDACDTILIPALGLAEQDRHRGNLDEKREKFVLESIGEMIEGIGQRVQSANTEKDLATGKAPSEVGSSHFSVFCLPAADQADEIGARLFVELLNGAGIPAECAAVETLAGEMMELVDLHKPDVVCISALPPAAVRQASYLCKRLQARFPELQIMVGLWDALGEPQKAKDRIASAGGNQTVITFAQGLEDLGQLEKALGSMVPTPEGPLTVAR
jgi:hypothetical protein